MSAAWSTPLDAVQRAFDLLICPPTPLAFDCRAFAGMPSRILPLDELKAVLIGERTPRLVRDAVWRELVVRARRDGPEWVVAAAGIALPGLRRMAGMLNRGWREDSADSDAELLFGFVEHLQSIDLAETRIVGKLIDAGARRVKKSREDVNGVDPVRVIGSWSLAPRFPWDHPDWVLSRAVAAAVIDPDECLLISATRLDRVELQVVADKLGIDREVATAWRYKAELRLAEAIRDGELDWGQLIAAAPGS